ncbi:MAG: DUF4199 domain-containing protein [Chitinophagales bacterium]|nr:DUF4199 domain-containing protein [Chitinophagales bacterium]
MNESKVNIWDISLSNGLYLGLFLILYSLIAYLIGIDKETWVGYSVYIIYFIAIIYVVLRTKKQNNGHLEFKVAYKIGFFTFLFAAIISTLYLIVHINWIDTHFIEGIQEVQRAKMIKDGIAPETADKAMAMAANFQKPAIFISMGFVSQVIIGSILSLISALISKSEK